MPYEEEDTCVSHEEEDTLMPHEEEDTCMSYAEEDTCVSTFPVGAYSQVKVVGKKVSCTAVSLPSL
jgi:hypothetical protein